jgi:hypothetical protein
MNKLLNDYKLLIDFEDKMQKDNYKFVEKYVKYQVRKNRLDWEQDCLEFLKDAIDLQKVLLNNIKNHMALFYQKGI